MNQTSRVLLTLVVFLSMACRKLAIDVGDATDGGLDGAAGAGGGGPGPTAGTDGDTGPTAGAGGAGSSGSSGGWITFEVPQVPPRQLDILFVIDNSLSMDPKQAALARNFPNMMKALESLPGGMPDVHIGVVSSDMGAGGDEVSSGCEGVLGNRGILWGNDPNVDPTEERNKYATVKDIKNSAGVAGCGMNSGARWIEDILNVDGITRDKNYQGNLSDVFSCLATAVGVRGCGYEHPLQALRVALNPMDNINPQNKGFLRDGAYLAIVIVSDEDDCSAEPDWRKNDKMFYPPPGGGTGSLRCAARGHVCNGQAIPNYDPESGYTGTAPFVANLSDCEAKDIARQPQVNGEIDPTYAELPLIRIRDMIDTVMQVKARPSEQILVAGIIGWPENGDLTGVEYRIDKDSTSMPFEQQKLWDYMPICTVPSERSADGNIYKAYAGLRLKKFIDGFGSNGQVYSLCHASGFSNAMQQIGNAVARRMRPGCVRYPLVDSNPSLPETQPECQVKDKRPCEAPNDTSCIEGYREVVIAQCVDSNGNTLPPSKSWQEFITAIPDVDAHRPCWYLSYDTNPNTGCADAPLGQRISVLRMSDGVAPPNTRLELTCLTCASASDLRCTSH